jgi:hypothetical protein
VIWRKLSIVMHVAAILSIATVHSIAKNLAPDFRLMTNWIASGVGVATGVLIVGLLGCFYKRNRTFGFILTSWLVLLLSLVGGFVAREVPSSVSSTREVQTPSSTVTTIPSTGSGALDKNVSRPVPANSPSRAATRDATRSSTSKNRRLEKGVDNGAELSVTETRSVYGAEGLAGLITNIEECYEKRATPYCVHLDQAAAIIANAKGHSFFSEDAFLKRAYSVFSNNNFTMEDANNFLQQSHKRILAKNHQATEECWSRSKIIFRSSEKQADRERALKNAEAAGRLGAECALLSAGG